eukprot:scaffold9446_cov122-Isochrysis_galbana.AAC.2
MNSGGSRAGQRARARSTALGTGSIARAHDASLCITCSAFLRLLLCLMPRLSRKGPSLSSSRHATSGVRPAAVMGAMAAANAVRGGGRA